MYLPPERPQKSSDNKQVSQPLQTTYSSQNTFCTLRRKGALPSLLDHSSGLLSTVTTTSESLSSPRAPDSSVLRPGRPSVAFPRSPQPMELVGCGPAGSCGELAAATGETQGRMRRTLAACRALPRAGSQGWAPAFGAEGTVANVLRHLQHVWGMDLWLWGCCLT